MKKETNILNITYDFPPSPFWGMGSSVKLLCDNIYKECNLVVATRYKEQKCSKKYPIIESSKETDSLFLTNEFEGPQRILQRLRAFTCVEYIICQNNNFLL